MSAVSRDVGPVASPRSSFGFVSKFLRILARPGPWLTLMATAFVLVASYAGYVNYLSLRGSIGNLPIFMQALSSTSHGYIPFFESSDCMSKARCSFLLVHPAFVLYAIVPIYLLAPGPLTLFTLQAVGVALAAVPLYYLTRRVTGSVRRALFAAGLYLVWAPLLEGIVGSMFVESFLPFEFLLIAALWEYGHQRLALGVAVLAFLTFEIGPVLGVLLGLFFLLPPGIDALRAIRSGVRWWRTDSPRLREVLRRTFGALRRGVARADVRYSLALLAMSAVALFLVYDFMNVFGAPLLGVASPRVPAGLAGVFYDNSSVPRAPTLRAIVDNPGAFLGAKTTLITAEYWLVLFGLLGFLPLLAPRALVLTVPWMAYTFSLESNHFTSLGNYSPGIAAVGLSIGLSYGLRQVPESWFHPRSRRLPTPAGTLTLRPSWRHRLRDRRLGRPLWVIAVLVLVSANVMLSPVDPVLPSLHAKLGEPFSNIYFVSLSPSDSGIGALERLSGLVPLGSTVAVAQLLAPLVINDPYAYILYDNGSPFWEKENRLPFSVLGGPQFAVLYLPASARNVSGYVPPALESALGNSSEYGARAYVQASAVGPVFLYEKGYHGPVVEFGPTNLPVSGRFEYGSGLVTGPGGLRATTATNPPQSVVLSRKNVTGAPFVEMLPVPLTAGSYTIGLVVHDKQIATNASQSAPVVRVTFAPFGGGLTTVTYNASQLPTTGFVPVSFEVSLATPVLYAGLFAAMISPAWQLAVESVSISPAAAP